jgi:hypothetical protein
MRNKHKAIKAKALQKKSVEAAVCAELGLSPADALLSVGVVVNHVNMSQLNFFLLNSINAFSRRYVGVDVGLFAQQESKPCITPLCPLYDVQKLASWTHPIIATSTSACLEALTSKSPLVMHYVFEADFLGRRDLSTADLRQAFRDPRIRVVARGEDYRRLVETEFDIRPNQRVVPHAQFDVLVELLIKEPRGGHESA